MIAIALGLKPNLIKAEVLENWSVSENRYRYDDHGTNTYSSWQTTPYTWNPTLPVDKIQFRVKANNGFSYENTYILQFGYKPTPQAVTPIGVNIYTNINQVVYEDIVCTTWAYNSNDYNLVKCSFTPHSDISSSTYLYVEINLTSGYLTSIRPYMYGFEERKGTNAVITDTGNQIIINIEEQTTVIENAIENSTTNIIEGLKEQNNVCRTIYVNNKVKGTLGVRLNNNGSVLAGNNYLLTDYIELGENAKVKQKNALSSSYYSCWFDENKNVISCFYPTTTNNNTYLTIPTNAKYLQASLPSTGSTGQKIIYEVEGCINGNQAIMDAEHTYTEEKNQELIDYEDTQDSIDNQLDLDTTNKIDIALDTNSNNFIWMVFDSIKNINNKIILFFNSIMALGIIKMILGR